MPSSEHITWVLLVCSVGDESFQKKTRGLVEVACPSLVCWESPDVGCFDGPLSDLPHSIRMVHVPTSGSDQHWGKNTLAKLNPWFRGQLEGSPGAAVWALALPMDGGGGCSVEARESGLWAWSFDDPPSPEPLVLTETVERDRILKTFVALCVKNFWSLTPPISRPVPSGLQDLIE